ncbi:hypothetical protein QU803_17165 [Enterobacter hormaechei subsp. steigerwaltii]|uniref:hypothetical protein n=1 Tax=Enterobacter hormaechei TaxID=158836 RepID=UPI00222EC9D6|nr:hypothetical protein [Enterobacter hormaechei]MDM9326412.1 hypothetical protein [Enterobacter hormaechei subsp. steigerwaltii]
MSNIDKQAVHAVADLKAGYTLGHADVAILNELARIALASLEAEAVAYMYKDNLHADARFSLHTRFGNWSQEDINEYEITEIPLYTAPPAPVSVPEMKPIDLDEGFDEWYSEGESGADSVAPEWFSEAMKPVFLGTWRACRAAMLQGADGNSPAHSGCRPAQNCISPAQCGNSPEIPDGWVMLPAEPTQAMMNAWLSEVANWRGHAAGYRAMIAAAPQQEVK